MFIRLKDVYNNDVVVNTDNITSIFCWDEDTYQIWQNENDSLKISNKVFRELIKILKPIEIKEAKKSGRKRINI